MMLYCQGFSGAVADRTEETYTSPTGPTRNRGNMGGGGPHLQIIILTLKLFSLSIQYSQCSFTSLKI